MKTLNFTAKEILPSLLDKSKTQTIRKAWIGKASYIKPIYSKQKTQTNFNKVPKFKVGDKVDIVWDEKSKYTDFYKDNGKRSSFGEHTANNETLTFNKNLGTVKITEVFKIEMRITNGFNIIDWVDTKSPKFSKRCVELPQRDGFKNSQDMFKWFDKKYELDKPKEFWVYRWKWL